MAGMPTMEGIASHMHQTEGMPCGASTKSDAEADAETESPGGAEASQEAATTGSTPRTAAISSSEVGDVYEF